MASAEYPLEHLKARRMRRKQFIWEPKRKTLEVNTIHPMRYPSMTNLLRAPQVPQKMLQHPLQLPLHTQRHTQSSPTSTPPMAEGVGFTGMPYRTYAVHPVATAPPMATAVSEPVASSSTYTGIHDPMPRRCAEDYHRPPTGVGPTFILGYAAPETGYAMPVPGFRSLSGLRGPESCRGRSRGSREYSNRSLTRSEITKALRCATDELVADQMQEMRDKLKPLIPPDGSPVTIGASGHRVQANHLIGGLTHTLSAVRICLCRLLLLYQGAPSCLAGHRRPTAMWRIPHELRWISLGLQP